MTAAQQVGDPALRRILIRRLKIPRLPSVDGALAQLLLGVLLAGFAALLRMGLSQIEPSVLPFALFFPAVLVAGVVGDWTAALACLGVSLAVGVSFGLTSQGLGVGTRRPLNMLLFAASGGAVAWTGAYLRAMVRELRSSQETILARTLTYDTLFSTISEGFAICEAIRNAEGRLIDYQVEEMNPALRQMLGIGEGASHGRLSDAKGDFTDWLALCDNVLETGRPAAFEQFHEPTGRWREIRVSRLTSSKMAQFFIDITARKAEQERQAQLFDELNHRVKNNLAIVSAMLSAQARTADRAAGDELLKAVARVHSIADLHASLYKSHQSREVELGAYLSELCQNLSRSLVADERIRILVEAEPLTASVDDAVPLGLIVSELVTNAVKYAYGLHGMGDILVTLAKDERGRPCLTVADFGCGLSEGTPAASGLGSRLVRSLVQQLGGELRVSSDRGARFEVRLPDPAQLSAGK